MFLRIERRVPMARKHGFFRGAVDALIAAREKQVSRYVDRALRMMDDSQLKAHGYSRDELKRRIGLYY
jgi:hypothetical protein